jgi:hypothetical protein
MKTGSWRPIRTALTVRKQRAKLINDLPPEFRKLIEDVTFDRNGNVIPKALRRWHESALDGEA